MKTPDAMLSKLEREIAAAIDEMLAALASDSPPIDVPEGAGPALERYLAAVRGLKDAAEDAGAAALRRICALAEWNLSALHAQGRGVSAEEQVLLGEWPVCLAEMLGRPGDAAAAAALVRHLEDPRWIAPLGPEEGEAFRAMLREAPSERPGEPQSDAASWAGETDEAAGSPVSLTDAEEFAPAAAEAPTDEAAPEAIAAPEPEQAAGTEQEVSAELLSILMTELGNLKGGLEQLLAAAVSASAPEAARREAAESYAEEMARLGATLESIGLIALARALATVHRNLTASGECRITSEQRVILALLPGLVLTYLASPDDPSACEGLVDLLRSEAWPQPLAPAGASALARELALVKVTEDASQAVERQAEARPEDLLLAFPEDLNQELLEGLLQELPVQTAEFSGAIQRLAAGRGSMADVDNAKRAAHTLKGAANTVGIKGIANLTHHLEDILVALSRHDALPGRALAGTLMEAGDCLEAMSEAVMGQGPAPERALAVFQEVLDWANRIDREGVPEDAGAAEAAAARAGALPEEGGKPAASAQPGVAMARVPAPLIDDLLRLTGETIIATGQIHERLRKVIDEAKAIRSQSAAFIQLAQELEHLVDVRGIGAAFRSRSAGEEFDPLEFEHYSEIHTVSRRLIEAATDAQELEAGVEGGLAALIELVGDQNRLHLESQNAVMRTRMVPVATLASRLARSVRQTCRLLDKPVALHLAGAETLVDSQILNDLVDPLMHLLRNAVDHGIETRGQRLAAGKPAEGSIHLGFSREGNHVVVRCQDDGAGLDLAAIRRIAEAKGMVVPEQTLSDEELARLILAPGFSTRLEATQVSGRGIGLDVMYSRVLHLKGSLNLRSTPGQGLLVELRVPAALISTHALRVRTGARTLAVSSHGIQDIHYVTDDQVQKIGATASYRVGDDLHPVLELETLLNLPVDRRREARGGFPVLLVRQDSGGTSAVRVQELLDSRDLVVKNLGRYVPRVAGIAGATILGDGTVAPVVDLPELMRTPVRLPAGMTAGEVNSLRAEYAEGSPGRLTALVVDDSLSARRATAQFLKDAGFEVRTAIDGLEAVGIVQKWSPDVLLVDMEMPRMNGLELTTHVRAQSATRRTPIVMITSRSTEKHRRQAEAAGVNVYLTKPFSDDELLRHVTQLTAARNG